MAEFVGFDEPKQNWSKLPHQLIETLPLITSEGELKIILYILRHTWGFHDNEKRITLEEFANGRKRKDGSRYDSGTGLTIPTIRDGLKRAIEHGFIVREQDKTDRARVKNFYSLKMQEDEKDLQPDCKKDSPKVQESLPRSEKETLETNQQKETEGAGQKTPPPPFEPSLPPTAGLPRATDSHQRAIDKANGGKVDQREEVARHLYWGFEGGPCELPGKKAWGKWDQGGQRLLDKLPKTLELQEITRKIDAWFIDETDQFWHSQPLHDTALELIARFIKNGGSHANHNHPGRISPGLSKPYDADPADFDDDIKRQVDAEIAARFGPG